MTRLAKLLKNLNMSFDDSGARIQYSVDRFPKFLAVFFEFKTFYKVVCLLHLFFVFLFHIIL